MRGRLLFLICLATLPAILFSFYVADQERTAALSRTQRDALHLAHLTSREHAHQILGTRRLLEWLGVQVAAGGTQAQTATDPEFLRALLAGHPQVANIGILAPDGSVVASAYALPSYRSWHDNPAFVAALRSHGVATGRYIISPIFAHPTLNHTLAIRDASGEVMSVLFTGLDLDWLSDLADQSRLPEGLLLLITDEQGQVLASKGAGHANLASNGARVSGIAGIARSGKGRVLSMGDDGPRRYFVAVPLGEVPGVFVAIGLSQETIVGDANEAFARVIAGLSVLTLFTIVAVFVAAEIGLLRVLRALARTVQRFGAGALDARISVGRGHNELTTLAGAFNTMADSLAARNREAIEAQARLRALAQRLHTVREAEAKRIARDLHDQVGQLITSLKIDLTRLASHCPEDDRGRACAEKLCRDVETMSREIDAALHLIRGIVADLRPGVLDQLGLIAALLWQAQEIEARSGVVVQVEADDIGPLLDERTAVTFFRVAQEALTNVVRHAQARTVEIRLVNEVAGLVMEIRDDGVGIDEAAVDGLTSLGIIGMRERALLAGGQVSVFGAGGRGTTVRVTLPRSTQAEPNGAHSSG